MANSEINRKTLLTGIIDTNSKSEISIFQMRLGQGSDMNIVFGMSYQEGLDLEGHIVRSLQTHVFRILHLQT